LPLLDELFVPIVPATGHGIEKNARDAFRRGLGFQPVARTLHMASVGDRDTVQPPSTWGQLRKREGARIARQRARAVPLARADESANLPERSREFPQRNGAGTQVSLPRWLRQVELPFRRWQSVLPTELRRRCP